MRRFDAVVVMGPPGSGKTHLGHILAARGAVAYVEHERVLMEKFGSGAEFAANKAEALRFLDAARRELIATSALPVFIESTGLSDAESLVRLAEETRVAFVALLPPKAVCMARVGGRAGGGNLNNNPVQAGAFHDYWMREVRPRFAFSLELAGLDSLADANRITDLVSTA